MDVQSSCLNTKSETASISNTNTKRHVMFNLFLSVVNQWIHRSFSYTTQKQKERKDDAKFNITFLFRILSLFKTIYWTKIRIIVSMDLCNLTMRISFSKRTKKKKKKHSHNRMINSYVTILSTQLVFQQVYEG